jgi:cytochrome d ubiquinol oxidase subunit II
VVSLETIYVRPEFLGNLLRNPVSWLGIIVVLSAAGALFFAIRKGQEEKAFFASASLIAGLLGTGASTIFPVMLYSTLSSQNSMTAYASASSPSALLMAIIWWPVSFILAAFYFVYLYRHYSGKVRAEDTQGYY